MAKVTYVQRDVHAAMLGKSAQHMVQKSETSVNIGLARAVNVDGA